MLVPSLTKRYAHQLIRAHDKARIIPSLTSHQALSIEDGYQIAKHILEIRVPAGETVVGRKIGFAKHPASLKSPVDAPASEPIWAHMFASSVCFAKDNYATFCVKDGSQPRIEPEIVFKLGQTPKADASPSELAECIEWMAHGLEIEVCPYPNWEFETAEAVAAFALHGALIIGTPQNLTSANRRNLSMMLALASVSLSCEDELRAAGFGGNALNSPLQALWNLHSILKKQHQFAPLAAGEIIATGGWTDAYPIHPGEIWRTAFCGIALHGLILSCE